MVPGTMVFAAAYGTLAAQKGLTLTEAVLMSALVFGGASQLVAMEVWTNPMTLATVVSLAVVTAIVNARFILMGATLRPWFGALPPWQVYPALQLDRGRDLARRDALSRRGRRRMLRSSSARGSRSGSCGSARPFRAICSARSSRDPKRFGFDLMLPIFFAAMFVPLWRGARRATGWAIAGVVALVVSYVVPGWWFIVIGALAGSIVGAFIDDE